MDRLAEIQARVAELQEALDAAPDEETARSLADELHALMGSVENVRVLRSAADDGV